eukprot:TRINITY_DN5237_c0_g1_i2.p1 TRINITY_DN5237_c0_g1~~TRINITY_DN5237_c0_g1_i2.p1  ORF type:complete len:151 (+),score=31.62 TRINITY_DN5237_c0_g1_i2:100-552(+)
MCIRDSNETSYTDRTLSDRHGFVRGKSTSLYEDDYIPPPTEKAPYRRGSSKPDDGHHRSSAASSNSNWSSHGGGGGGDNRRDPAIVSVPMSAQSSARSEGGEGSLAERAASLSQQMQQEVGLSLIHISEPTRLLSISYAVFCLKKKKKLI